MTEAERRGLRALVVLILLGQVCVMASRRWPALFPDVVRETAPVAAARADPATQPAPPIPPRVPSGRVSRALTPAAHALDINVADAGAWCALPGIGAKKAAAILAERHAHGPFRSVQDLTRVRGIGPATVARLAPWLRCIPPEQRPSARER